MILRVVDLTHRRAGAHDTAIDGISFAVESGSMLLIAGPSGSGKTTLLRTLAGLDDTTSGTVTLDGQPLIAGDARACGLVFQTHELFPHLSARDNCALAPHAVLGLSRERAEARALDALASLGVRHVATRAPADLSHGERQRVAIARAIALEPKVLLLDEPAASLDPLARRDLLAVLQALKQRGLALVAVSHDLALLTAAEQLAILDRGRLVEGGPREELLHAPVHPTTSALLQAAFGGAVPAPRSMPIRGG